MSTGFQTLLQNGSMLAYPAAFLAGVVVSVSPCIYPLIPVTVSYISGRGGGKRMGSFRATLAYSTGIASTYALLGALAGLTGNLFGRISAHPVTSLVVGIVLTVMALAQIGAFTLWLPSFQMKGDPSRSRRGTFLFGMVAGLVVSPCTAPVFGALLLYVASKQNFLFGMSLMFTFALGMGALLVLLGTFAGLLAKLPRSGMWLLVAEKGVGTLMLLCGIYFVFKAAWLVF